MRFSIFYIFIVIATFTNSSDASAKIKGPCGKIRATCESAGYKKGGPNAHKRTHKNLWKDCFQPIMEAQVVANVTPNPLDVIACQNNMKKAKEVTPEN